MSCKKAWDIIDALNMKGKKPFVISHKGGEKVAGFADRKNPWNDARNMVSFDIYISTYRPAETVRQGAMT